MKQEEYLRLLPVEGAYNMRDSEGYPVAGHRRVKWKTSICSGDLGKPTESNLACLTSLSIRTGADFRSIQEKRVAVDRIPVTATQCTPLSIKAGGMTNIVRLSLDNIPKILEQAYIYIIQNAQDTCREFFRAVSEKRNTPLLSHRSAGKGCIDIAVALLSEALSVDRKVIMKDYMLSAEYLKGRHDAIVQAHPEFTSLTTVCKEYLGTAFQTIDSDY